MTRLWQLKNLSNGNVLNEPQPLPENWGPIFGMGGFVDRLGDLSWLGPGYTDLGWVEVGEHSEITTTISSAADLAWEKAKKLLAESDWSMLPDVMLLDYKKKEWENYRRSLREIRLHPDFPNMTWPSKPE